MATGSTQAAQARPANPAVVQPPSGRELALLLAIAFVAWFLRAPRVLLHGRLLLEEGTTYLRYAWDAPPLRAFFAPHQDYYSLLPNAIALLAARVFPLRDAGYLYVWSALLVQLVVVLVIVTLEVFPTPRARLLALITFLLATPSIELILNTIHSQFFLGLGTAALLVSAPDRYPRLRGAFLVFAGLNGPASCPFVPFYWLRVLFTRSRQALVQAVLLSGCALLQGLILLFYLRRTVRGIQHHDWKLLGAVLLQRVLLQPWLTGHAAGVYDRFLLAHFTPGWLALVSLIAALGVISLLCIAYRAGTPSLWLAAASFWCFFVYWYGALGADFNNLTPIGEDRYWFTANALLALSLLLGARNLRLAPGLRGVCMTLLLLGWVNGLLAYGSGWPYLHDYISWQDQVEAWQRNPSLELRSAPNEWELRIRLTPEHRNLPLPADTYDSSNPHRLP